MTQSLSRLLAPVAAAGQAGLGLYVWTFGSTAPIPMHFGLSGEVDRWGDRQEAGLMIGGMAAMTLLVGWAMDWSGRQPWADDARRRGLGHAKSLGVAAPVILSAMMAGVALSPNPAALGGQQVVLTAVCGLLAVVGAMMGKVAPNALVGVRTPWSLTSKLAWEKSNRLAGRLFFWGGLAGVFLAPVAPAPLGMRVLLAAVLLIGAVTVLESWRVWRSDPERRVV